MAPAALTGLYTRASTPSPTPKSAHHDLSPQDIKSLVSILSCHPSKPNDKYWTTIHHSIKSLPSHLRAPHLSKAVSTIPTHTTTPLCPNHSTLNPNPITSLWTTLRNEITHKLGPFLQPLLVSAGLPSISEQQLRHLEPILSMWIPGYDHTLHVPIGRAPVPCYPESGWTLQDDGCAACMLARLNSDPDVLFALLAVMVGRYRTRILGRSDKVKSLRVRWVRTALKGLEGGQRLVGEAWDLGVELKRVWRAWRRFGKERGVQDGWNELYGARRDGEGESVEGILTVGLRISKEVTGGEGEVPGVLYPPLRSTRRESGENSSHYPGEPVYRLPTPRRTEVEVHSLPHHHAAFCSHSRYEPSICSHQAKVDDAREPYHEYDSDSVASGYSSTASEEKTHNYRMHLYEHSLMPQPLKPSSKESIISGTSPGEEFLKMKKQSQSERYANFLDKPYKCSTLANGGRHGRGNTAERMSKSTVWSELYK